MMKIPIIQSYMVVKLEDVIGRNPVGDPDHKRPPNEACTDEVGSQEGIDVKWGSLLE
jgi:hypothetical protein